MPALSLSLSLSLCVCTYIELDLRTRPALRAEVKALGAKFDAERKRWYLSAGVELAERLWKLPLSGGAQLDGI